MTDKLTEIRIIALDPGITTGFADAFLNPESMKLSVKKLEAWRLPGSKENQGISFTVDSLGWYWEKLEDSLGEYNNTTHVAIEDYTGGQGGNLQNFINKMIGGFTKCTLVYSEDDNGLDIYPADLFPNFSRRPFLERAKAESPKGTSKHAIDAFAHLLHKIRSLYPKTFNTLSIELALASV